MSYVQGKWIILHTSHLQNSVLKTSSILSSAFSLHSDENTYSSSPIATCLFCSFKCFECLSSQLSQHTLDPKIHHKILNSVLPKFENLKGHKSYHWENVGHFVSWWEFTWPSLVPLIARPQPKSLYCSPWLIKGWLANPLLKTKEGDGFMSDYHRLWSARTQLSAVCRNLEMC